MGEAESLVSPIETVTKWYALVFSDGDMGCFSGICEDSAEIIQPRYTLGAIFVGSLSHRQAEQLLKGIAEKSRIDNWQWLPGIQLITEKTMRSMSKDEQMSFGLLLEIRKQDTFSTRDEAEDYMVVQSALESCISVADLIRKLDDCENMNNDRQAETAIPPVSLPSSEMAAIDDGLPSNYERDHRLCIESLNPALTWAEIAERVNNEFSGELLDSKSAPMAAKRFWKKHHVTLSLQPIPRRNPGRKPKNKSE